VTRTLRQVLSHRVSQASHLGVTGRLRYSVNTEISVFMDCAGSDGTFWAIKWSTIGRPASDVSMALGSLSITSDPARILVLALERNPGPVAYSQVTLSQEF